MEARLSVAVERAMHFVYRCGRPHDAAELAYHLGRGYADAAVELLSAYANPDGGFGNALEPDVRAAESTVLATTVAIQSFVRFKTNPYHPLIQEAMEFLVERYEPGMRNWPLVDSVAQVSACAPWWKGYDPENPSEVNPRAEILAYLIRYDHGKNELLFKEIRMVLLERLRRNEALDMYEVLSVARLLRTPGVDGELEKAAKGALERDLPKLIPTSPEAYGGHVLKPMTIARRPNSPLAGMVAKQIPGQHQYELQTQGANGSWAAPWNWGDGTAESRQADRDWRSNLTMLTATSLAAYGR